MTTTTTQPNMNDSKSLWNYTMSPGWTVREVEVFRLALMKFGLGRWSRIVEEGCLPGKTVGQLNNQMQRMIGQQSTGEFQGLHCDPQLIFAHNAAKEGVRKNGCLINTGENPTPESVRRKREENQARWGLSQAEIDAIVIPVLKSEETSSSILVVTIEARLERLTMLEALQGELAALAMKKAAGETLVSAGTMELLENSARVASNINLKLLADMKRKEANRNNHNNATPPPSSSSTSTTSKSRKRSSSTSSAQPLGEEEKTKKKRRSGVRKPAATTTTTRKSKTPTTNAKQRENKNTTNSTTTPRTEYSAQRPHRARKPVSRYDDDDDDDDDEDDFESSSEREEEEEEEEDEDLKAAIAASLATTSTAVSPEEPLMTLVETMT